MHFLSRPRKRINFLLLHSRRATQPPKIDTRLCFLCARVSPFNSHLRFRCKIAIKAPLYSDSKTNCDDPLAPLRQTTFCTCTHVDALRVIMLYASPGRIPQRSKNTSVFVGGLNGEWILPRPIQPRRP